MNLLTISTNVVITVISFNGKYSGLTISHGQFNTKHSRHVTLASTLDKPERVLFVITCNPALRSISSIIRKQFHILISFPRCCNVFKAAPIVAYSRSSNLSDFLVRAKRRNLTQPNQPRSLYPCGKTDLLANTDLTDKLHTHPTLHVKPDLSLITSTVTLKTSFTWHNATTASNNT